MKPSVFSAKIVEWYQEHHRRLPWRETKDPYAIWLSEVILQQTRVAQGLPYFEAFLKKYPTVRALASADEQSVLRLWQGLGYYSRARNLHDCARTIVGSYNGKFPRTYEELYKLKGIGEYTAAAIASFAFHEQVAVLDGNVFRVLSRVFGISDDIASPGSKKKFRELANRLLPKGQSAAHNQAIMEFGALQCTHLNPSCETCPLKRSCIAHQEGIQHELPVKSKPKKPVRRNFFYFVIRQGNKWLMKRRSGKDIWKGLWDFPLHEGRGRVSTKELSGFLPARVRSAVELHVSPVFRHVLSHQIIHARFVIANVPKGKGTLTDSFFADAHFFSREKIADLPKPVLVSRFLAQYSQK